MELIHMTNRNSNTEVIHNGKTLHQIRNQLCNPVFDSIGDEILLLAKDIEHKCIMQYSCKDNRIMHLNVLNVLNVCRMKTLI